MNYIPCLLPPQRVNAIRSLIFASGISVLYSPELPVRGSNVSIEIDENHLKDWIELWQTLSGMRSLSALHVDLRPVDIAGYFG